jgi:hypothetical protein
VKLLVIVNDGTVSDVFCTEPQGVEVEVVYDDPTRDPLAEGPLDDKPEWEFIKAEHYRIY